MPEACPAWAAGAAASQSFGPFLSPEVSLEFLVLEVFPGRALFKYEAEKLDRQILSTSVTERVKEELILAIGFGEDFSYQPVPFLELQIEVFIGMGFAQESRPDRARLGL
jgi:hypothetical protein